jgi:CDP-paratose 2-epimerase
MNKSLSYFGYGGNGKQVRDILHVSDLYTLIKKQMLQLDKNKNFIYNIGGGNEVSISLCELTQLCEKITKNKIKISSVLENRVMDIPYYISDTTKANKDFDWKPAKETSEIISEIVVWFNENIIC